MTDTTTEDCPACYGQGMVLASHRSPAGFRRDREATCLRCDGSGIVEHDPGQPDGVYSALLPIEAREAVRRQRALGEALRGKHEGAE